VLAQSCRTRSVLRLIFLAQTQISMEGKVTDLTDKEQAFFRAILFAGMSTFGAHLTGLVGIYFDACTARKTRLVEQEALQFGKRPLRGVPVSLALFLARSSDLLPFGPLPNAGQVLQPDESVGMGVNNALADGVIDCQLQPSLSSLQVDLASLCRT